MSRYCYSKINITVYKFVWIGSQTRLIWWHKYISGYFLESSKSKVLANTESKLKLPSTKSCVSIPLSWPNNFPTGWKRTHPQADLTWPTPLHLSALISSVWCVRVPFLHKTHSFRHASPLAPNPRLVFLIWLEPTVDLQLTLMPSIFITVKSPVLHRQKLVDAFGYIHTVSVGNSKLFLTVATHNVVICSWKGFYKRDNVNDLAKAVNNTCNHSDSTCKNTCLEHSLVYNKTCCDQDWKPFTFTHVFLSFPSQANILWSNTIVAMLTYVMSYATLLS